MPVIKESQLKAKAGSAYGSLGPTTPRRIAKALAASSVFLSHSSKDKDLALLVKTVLEAVGVSVYVDWLDEGLPSEVSDTTARILREKIVANDRLLLLATNNAMESKWVPWELGFADGRKGDSRIAILEVCRDGESFRGSEYLLLYPKLTLAGVPLPVYESHPGAQGRTQDVASWLR